MSRPAPSPIYTLRGAGGPLNTLHFSCLGGDTPLLFSGSGTGAIHIWNLNNRRAEKIVEGHSGSSVIWVNSLQSKDALISQGRDMQVCLWDLREGRSELVDSVWTDSVGFCQCSLLESSPGNYLLAFAGSQTEEIKIIELPSKTPVCTLVPDAKLGMVMCIKLWQPDSGPGPLLLAGYEDGSLLLWDVTQRSKLSQVKAHPEPVMCLTFDTKRLRGISGSSEKKLTSWMLDTQTNLQLQDCVTLVNPGVSDLCIRDDGKLLASAGWDHRVRVFGWKKLRPLAVLQYHTDVVLSVAFSNHQDPRQRLLAAGSKDQRISLWSIYNEGADNS
ncbi:guanine nucleotide-binding protein subunit beta-like protein 1 [Pleuronectes platessa]|uniref:guanine nucleotide-binding protein subunit beta-like protein 1 n=1 Tax=Pleuronectes platessa TaxID=8262 RepID=UPI00232A72A2|nr:guanine nucleotide-binding protein subunit beta-like protein 1 [Pleuronectes platessa]XP_053277328.1 guanine nucleotide-binding protein subunit beta-like protein 1 [Pleuronectes platessa]XP_053277329.1 guanine nucleotide-binding protein subunit beta-like protein 1 [Pleuronectes platessa]XP_053277330.1 guanine nucleotide-binding protein subunit beta-like protein 1 [Pleuronectes platessa]XP_053277331.1 guanine nucleotide-binding protein subunit beta-like protein 1 [Pleuronectes platessa]XP_05